jgi:hypothetical protein
MSGIGLSADCVNLFNYMKTRSFSKWVTFRIDSRGSTVRGSKQPGGGGGGDTVACAGHLRALLPACGGGPRPQVIIDAVGSKTAPWADFVSQFSVNECKYGGGRQQGAAGALGALGSGPACTRRWRWQRWQWREVRGTAARSADLVWALLLRLQCTTTCTAAPSVASSQNWCS